MDTNLGYRFKSNNSYYSPGFWVTCNSRINSKNQQFEQKLKEIELFQSIQFEKIKTEISVKAQLNKSSVDYIAKVWEKVNEVNLGSEVITFNYFTSNSIPDSDYIPYGDEPIINLSIAGLSDNELISFNPNTSELKNQIIEAEKYINKNRFWLDEEQRALLIDFLKLNYKVAHQIEKDDSLNKIMKSKLELDSLRMDIFKYRDILFNE